METRLEMIARLKRENAATLAEIAERQAQRQADDAIIHSEPTWSREPSAIDDVSEKFAAYTMTDAMMLQRLRSFIAEEVASQIESMVEPKIDAALDDVAQLTGELLKEVDHDVRAIISRIVDLEVVAKHRNDALSTDTASELKTIKDMLGDALTKLDRNGEKVVTLPRKSN
jgi:hypothetical protein